MVTPRQQLRHTPGYEPGMPLADIVPMDWAAIANKPTIFEPTSHPMLNVRKWVYTRIDCFGSAVLGEWISVAAGAGVGSLNSVGGAVVIQTTTGIGNYDTLCAGHVSTYLSWSLAQHAHFETLLALGTALGTNAVKHVGFAIDHTLAAPSDLACFRTTGTGNWLAVTRTGGAATETDTGIAPSLNVRLIFEVWADLYGARVNFRIWDDSAVRAILFETSHTTNIPSGAMAGGLSVKNNGDVAARAIQIDYGECYELRSGQNP